MDWISMIITATFPLLEWLIWSITNRNDPVRNAMMESQLNTGNASLVSRLREIITPETEIWLVGGAVRDQLSGKTSHDLDFVLPGNVRPVARQVADSMGGAFFALDEERGMYRVLQKEENQLYVIDFCRLQADSLKDDLALRDFTINAIAVKLHDPSQWLDPLNGRQDLKDRILRPCSPGAFTGDPVRTIRAVRLSLEFGLHLAPGVIDLIREAVPLLDGVSTERKRDEFFKILEGINPASGIRLLYSLRILEKLIPELLALRDVQQPPPHTMDVWNHSLAVVSHLDRLLDLFLAPGDLLKDGGNLMLGLTAGKLGKFQPALVKHFSDALNPFRSRRSLCLLGGLLHDIGKPATQTVGSDGRIHFYGHERAGADMADRIGKSLALSEAETQALVTMTLHHIDPHFVAPEDSKPSRKLIYRYYRLTRDTGVDICFIGLADYLSRTEYPPEQDAWIKELDRIAIYLEGWFIQRKSWVEPERFLSGDELMSVFNLSPGKLIGDVLDQLKEAAASGEITNREEALEMAKVIIFNPARESDED